MKFLVRVYQNKPLRILLIISLVMAAIALVAYLDSLSAKAERNVIAGEHSELQKAISSGVTGNATILKENHDLLIKIDAEMETLTKLLLLHMEKDHKK
jgi:hypothetical protein